MKKYIVHELNMLSPIPPLPPGHREEIISNFIKRLYIKKENILKYIIGHHLGIEFNDSAASRITCIKFKEISNVENYYFDYGLKDQVFLMSVKTMFPDPFTDKDYIFPKLIVESPYQIDSELK